MYVGPDQMTTEEIEVLAKMTPAEAVRHFVRFRNIDNSHLQRSITPAFTILVWNRFLRAALP